MVVVTRRCGCALAAFSIVAVSAGFTAAAEPPPKRITLSGRAFASPVTVVFAAPAGYTSGFGGAWTGPPWSSPSGGGVSGLTVNVGSDEQSRSAEQAARNKLVSYAASWTVVSSGPLAVPRIVAGRKVGGLQGFFLIMHNPLKGYEGWYRAAVGVSLGKGYPLLAAVFLTTTPSSDASQTIEGTTPSVWNRQAIDQALRGMAVEGLPVVHSPAQPARCFGMPRTVSGTAGTDGDDVIIGGSGNDTLRGLGGNDTICGGAGNDTISAGAGDDRLDGRDGNDRLDGGGGKDRLLGGEGSDRVEGGPGDDDFLERDRQGDNRLNGGSGNDKLNAQGAGGKSTLDGGAGHDSLLGGSGDDTLNGGDGNDFLQGDQGSDELSGGPGDDELRGGPGADRLRGGPGRNRLIGGPGHDRCDSVNDFECEDP